MFESMSETSSFSCGFILDILLIASKFVVTVFLTFESLTIETLLGSVAEELPSLAVEFRCILTIEDLFMAMDFLPGD